MKTFSIFICLFAVLGCKSKLYSDQVPSPLINEVLLEDGSSAKSGNVVTKNWPNSSIEMREDGINRFYAEIVSGSSDSSVITIKYSQPGPEGTVDGDYSETLYFEIPNTVETLELSETGLQNVKMTYEKACYCKGDAGFYEVTNGFLKIQKKKNLIVLETEFSIPETSQQMKKVSQQIAL